jgi:hypothetical protein
MVFPTPYRTTSRKNDTAASGLIELEIFMVLKELLGKSREFTTSREVDYGNDQMGLSLSA